MNRDELYEMLRKVQESQGYCFNADKAQVLELLDGLLINKERYGYMSCPCRLAANDREKDKDIMCPCLYRKPDVDAFGSCYCSLYVSKEWNEGKISHEYVPERRP
jgi:ferredoxin-thioredoxin reductase catalytic subunit